MFVLVCPIIIESQTPLFALDIRPQKPILNPEIQLPVNCQTGKQRWNAATQQTMSDFYKFPMTIRINLLMK